ncbi:hypothetical protein [Nocardioides sp.]|uniref:hypothetical protein n=1 Tax=Nocardioides sp. TaxID=35761 RepID=UPI0037840EF9
MSLARAASGRLALLTFAAVVAGLAAVVPATSAQATPPVNKYCQTQQDAYDFWTYEARYTTSPSYWDYATDRANRALVNLNRYCNL